MSETAVINLSNVSKSFPNRVVLTDISFTVTAGQGLCVCGPNAVGKTTLLRIIAGLSEPGCGEVNVCGLNVQKEPEKTRSLVGLISHKPMVYAQLTVEENLRFFSRMYGIKNGKSLITQMLELTGLSPYRHDRAGILSAGLTRRLAIARATIHKPKALLADEPFAGLDSQGCEYLVTMLGNFKDTGGAVLMTTHHVDLSFRCCEQAAVLDDKKIIFNRRISQIDKRAFAGDYLSYARARS